MCRKRQNSYVLASRESRIVCLTKLQTYIVSRSYTLCRLQGHLKIESSKIIKFHKFKVSFYLRSKYVNVALNKDIGVVRKMHQYSYILISDKTIKIILKLGCLSSVQVGVREIRTQNTNILFCYITVSLRHIVALLLLGYTDI